MILLTVSFYGNAVEIPYEKQCSPDNLNWTNQFIHEDIINFDPAFSSAQTEAQAPCIKCSTENNITNSNSVDNINNVREPITPVVPDIPEVCFYASAIHSSIWEDKPYQYWHCESAQSARPTKQDGDQAIRPCLNEDYVQSTAKAFNQLADCFEFSSEEKEQIFKMFHHESRWMLNAKSSKEARCYGQLTSRSILEINHRIKLRTRMSSYTIYDSVVKKCPGLADKVLPPSVARALTTEQMTRKVVGDTRYLKGLDTLKEEFEPEYANNNNSLTCGLTHDPYSCLFYALFDIKKNMDTYDNTLDNPKSYVNEEIYNTPGYQTLKEDFLMPIQLDEMLVIKGEFINTETGEKLKCKDRSGNETTFCEMTFWDDSELLDTLFYKYDSEGDLKQKYRYNRSNMQIMKISVFNTEKLKPVLTALAHSGGASVAGPNFRIFMESIKRRISARVPAYMDYRNSLLDGQVLSREDLIREHADFSRRNRIENYREVMSFQRKIDNNIEILRGESTTDDSAPGKLKEKVPFLSDSQVGEFFKTVQDLCPK